MFIDLISPYMKNKEMKIDYVPALKKKSAS